MYRVGHDGVVGFIVQGKIILHVQNADHVIQGVLADGIAGMARGVDDVFPFFHAVALAQEGDLRAVGAEFLHSAVVKLEDILDELLLLHVEHALARAGIHHGLDLLFADLLVVRVGVDAQQTQDAVGGHGQDPDDRCKDLRHHRQHGGHGHGQLFGFLHGQTLGHQLAEDQRKVGQDDRDHNDGDGIEHFGGQRDAGGQEHLGQRVGEVVCGEGAAQEAGEGDGDLDGGQKAGRLLDKALQALGAAVAVFRHFGDFAVVEGDDGDLSAGKNSVERDQDHLQQQGK